MRTLKLVMLPMVALALLGTARSEKQRVVELVTVKGYVEYVYDEDDNPIGATLELKNGTVYKIVWDSKGREMADEFYELYYEEIEATGEVSEKDGKKWLRVTSYKGLESSSRPEDLDEELKVL